jgi:hypothetical protein
MDVQVQVVEIQDISTAGAESRESSTVQIEQMYCTFVHLTPTVGPQAQ